MGRRRDENGEERGGRGSGESRGVYRQPLPQQTMKIVDMRGPLEPSCSHDIESKEKRKSKKVKKEKKRKKESGDDRSSGGEESDSESEENDSVSSSSISDKKSKKKKKDQKHSKKKKDKKEKSKGKEKSSHKWNPFLHLFALRISDTTREFRVGQAEEQTGKDCK
jgi:type IV secretory pathway VirB10-like protein